MRNCEVGMEAEEEEEKRGKWENRKEEDGKLEEMRKKRLSDS